MPEFWYSKNFSDFRVARIFEVQQPAVMANVWEKSHIINIYYQKRSVGAQANACELTT